MQNNPTALNNAKTAAYGAISQATGTPSPAGTPATRTVDEIRARTMGIPVAQLIASQNDPNYGAVQTYNTLTGANEFTPKSTVAAFPYNYTQWGTFSGANVPSNFSTPAINPSTYTTQQPTTNGSLFTADPFASMFAWALMQQQQRQNQGALNAANTTNAPTGNSPYPTVPNTFTPTIDNIQNGLGNSPLASYISDLYQSSPSQYIPYMLTSMFGG
jgi:hypothetical protein